MPITERTLKRWRKDALKDTNKDAYEIFREYQAEHEDAVPRIVIIYRESQKRILRMTQELLDLHLIRK